MNVPTELCPLVCYLLFCVAKYMSTRVLTRHPVTPLEESKAVKPYSILSVVTNYCSDSCGIWALTS